MGVSVPKIMNVGQDAHPMNRGSYFCKQMLKVCEIDLLAKGS